MTLTSTQLMTIKLAAETPDESRQVAAIRALQGLGSEPLLTVEELMKAFRIGRSTVYATKPPVALKIGKSPRYRRSEVEAFFDAKEAGTKAKVRKGGWNGEKTTDAAGMAAVARGA